MTPRPSPSATPSPSAGPSPTPTSASIGGVNFVAPTSSGTGGDLYDLGPWGGQKINIQGFPSALATSLVAALSQTQKPGDPPIDLTAVTGDQLAKAITDLKDPAAISQVQQMLYYAGFYPTSVTSLNDLQHGSLGDKDFTALKVAIQTGGRADEPFGSYMSARANTGFAQGIINQTAGIGANQIKAPNQVDEDAALRRVAQQLLGHDPSAADLAGFRAFADQKFTEGQKQAIAQQQQQTAQTLPDAQTLGQAGQTLGVQGFFGNPAPPQTIPGSVDATNRRMNPDFGGGPGSNPVYAYWQQQKAAHDVLNQVGDVASANSAGGDFTTITAAPSSMEDTAAAYLRQNDAAGVGAQNVATKYATLLSILGGTGK